MLFVNEFLSQLPHLLASTICTRYNGSSRYFGQCHRVRDLNLQKVVWITNSKCRALDPAKSALGGRKPTDITQAELEQMTPEQQLALVKDAHAQGKKDEKDGVGSLRIKIELDIDVEVHLTARVKGDIVIGLL